MIIVGAGIGGLTLAASLRQRGIACQVLERAHTFAPVGAGIVLSVNAMNVMRSLGMADDIARRGHVVDRVLITEASGKVLSATDVGSLVARFGPTVAIHRADLHDVLLSAVGAGSVSLNAEVNAVVEGGAGIRVRTADGTERMSRLLVGADGLKSRVRQLCFGGGRFVYAGYTCWRFVVEAPPGKHEVAEMLGRGQRFGVVPIGRNRLYCYAVTDAPEGQPGGSVQEVRARFRGFGANVPAILERLERDDQLIHNDLGEVHVDKWQKPRVVLLGDAAHASTPNMGQGAAMAIEDAAVLAECVATMGVENPAALAAWETRRKPRALWVQTQSRRIGAVGQWSNPVARALRSLLFRAAPASSGTALLRRLAEQPI